MKAVVLEERTGPAPTPHEAREFGAVLQLALRFGVVAILGYSIWLVVAPLFSIICWGFILAIALSQAYEHLARWVGPASAAVLLAVAGVTLTIGPMAWLAASLVDSVSKIYSSLESGQLNLPAPPARLEGLWLIGEPLNRAWKLAVENIEEAVRQYAAYLKPIAIAVIGFARAAFTSILQLLVATVLAAWILYCGGRLQRLALRLLRVVFQKQTGPVVRATVSTIRGMAKGVIAVAAIQAMLAAVGFLAAGTPLPGLLTFAVLALSVIQIGPALVLLPVCVWGWMALPFAGAVVFTAYMIVVGILDNVLRPLLIARDITAPLPLIVGGTIGGVISLGLVGVFLGPIIMSIAWIILFSQTARGAARLRAHHSG